MKWPKTRPQIVITGRQKGVRAHSPYFHIFHSIFLWKIPQFRTEYSINYDFAWFSGNATVQWTSYTHTNNSKSLRKCNFNSILSSHFIWFIEIQSFRCIRFWIKIVKISMKTENKLKFQIVWTNVIDLWYILMHFTHQAVRTVAHQRISWHEKNDDNF